MTKSLPITSDEFHRRLVDLGLIPPDILVESATVYARPGQLVTLELVILPTTEIADALK